MFYTTLSNAKENSLEPNFFSCMLFQTCRVTELYRLRSPSHNFNLYTMQCKLSKHYAEGNFSLENPYHAQTPCMLIRLSGIFINSKKIFSARRINRVAAKTILIQHIVFYLISTSDFIVLSSTRVYPRTGTRFSL